MKEDKAHILRKTVIVITIILIFATAGLFLVSTQVKTVRVNYFGNEKIVKTLANSVDSFLIQNKIYVNDDQILKPARNSKITNNLEIIIYSEKELALLNVTEVYINNKPMVAKIEEVEEDIPFSESQVESSAIYRGTTKVVQEGTKGKQNVKYIVKYDGNKELYRAKIDSTIISDVKNKVVEVGTKLAPIVSRAVASPVRQVTTDGGFKKYSIKLSENEQKFAYNLCKKYNLDYELFLAMMYKESGYNKNALGGGNSYGLCQVHISNHSKLRAILGINNFFDSYDNMEAGAYMLALYFGSARKMVSDPVEIKIYALNSYNMGEGSYYKNCFSKGVINRSYSTSILNLRNKLITQGWL